MACLYRLMCSDNDCIFELFDLAFEIEDLRYGDIDADGDLVAVVVKAVPEDAALLPYQLAFGQVAYKLSSYIEDVDVHCITCLSEMVVDETGIIEAVAVG